MSKRLLLLICFLLSIGFLSADDMFSAFQIITKSSSAFVSLYDIDLYLYKTPSPVYPVMLDEYMVLQEGIPERKINIIITKDDYVPLKKSIFVPFLYTKEKEALKHPTVYCCSLRVYTNPTTNLINIEFKGAKSCYKVKVYNLKGELVKEDMVEPDSKLMWNTLDKNGKQVAQGIYLIQTEVRGKKLTQKICVIK